MSTEEKSLNFIEQIIEEDLASGLSKDKLRFRFPPEPNGYLHVGHASAICLEYGIYDGNFIRAMLKLGNLIEEWMNMLTYLHKTELLEKYKDLKDSVLKGIVKPQSLYLTL